ncbi:MAG: TadE family protein [Bryobacteraceae bacterium]
MRSNEQNGPSLRRRRQRGENLIEFTNVLLPLLAIIMVIMDASWGIFIKATLQYAVRTGVRTGITITKTQATAANSDLTTMVKSSVQSHALGLLGGATGLSYIQVHYLEQNSTSSTGVTDVSTSATGDAPGNIMQVEVVNYPLSALTVRIYTWALAAQNSATNLNVVSADEIEPSSDVPPIGKAP